MKAKLLILALFSSVTTLFAQDRTTVTATTNDISDNLDLRAVASIFGDSENLEDFERRLNDPKTQISNLDLNRDNQVDYLRVIESIEGYTHLIIVQSVLERDVFQDVATIEVERGSNNQVQVQFVGDVYMYGTNYIYEPVYYHTPLIYNNFWAYGYHPYYSNWYWGYYPTYYYAWNPCPVFRYRNYIHHHINTQHYYNYVNIRRSERAVAMYGTRRSNGYERRNPEGSFAIRNAGVSNRHELVETRGVRETVKTTTVPGTAITETAANTKGTRNNGSAALTNNNTPSMQNNSTVAPKNPASHGTRSITINPAPNSDTASIDVSPTTPVNNISTSPAGIRNVTVPGTDSETVPKQVKSTDQSSQTSTPRNTKAVQTTPSAPRGSSQASRGRNDDSERSYSPRETQRPSQSQRTYGNSGMRNTTPTQSSSKSSVPQGSGTHKSTGLGRH